MDAVVIGAPEVTVWVESSDSDADIFVYLEDEDPVTGKARSTGLPSVNSFVTSTAFFASTTAVSFACCLVCMCIVVRGEARQLSRVRVAPCCMGVLRLFQGYVAVAALGAQASMQQWNS